MCTPRPTQPIGSYAPVDRYKLSLKCCSIKQPMQCLLYHMQIKGYTRKVPIYLFIQQLIEPFAFQPSIYAHVIGLWDITHSSIDTLKAVDLHQKKKAINYLLMLCCRLGILYSYHEQNSRSLSKICTDFLFYIFYLCSLCLALGVVRNYSVC